MSLRFSCLCGRKLKTGDATAGKKAKCPGCGRWLRVPDASSYEVQADETTLKLRATPVADPDESSEVIAGCRAAAAKAAAKAEPPAAAAKASPAQATKGRVLLADADAEDMASVQTTLLEHGYDIVGTTNNGRQVVEMARALHPDAIIMDVRLEEMSGFQAVQQLHDPTQASNRDVWEIPVIMTTQRLRGRDKQYAISLRVLDYVEKPLSPATLSARLEKAVSHRRVQPSSP